jgi:endonuclease YncB( thermonuclease family)
MITNTNTSLAYLKSEDVALFSLQDQIIEAKCVQVYDGDSATILFHLPGTSQVVKMKCRIEGVDAPEIKPPSSQPNREEIKRKAVVARNRLCCLLTGCSEWSAVCDQHHKTVMLKCGSFDKYGRLLVRDVDDKIVPTLLEEGHCHAYDGQCTKPSWS